jgi:hypothetical protein
MHQLYELNVRTWRTDRSRELGRPATLDDLSFDVLDHLVENGFTWLYLLGVWKTGPLSRQLSLADDPLRQYLSTVLSDFRDDDICGSPLAHAGYEVPEELGNDDALARLRERAQSAGLSLMLDFIPNHVGLDHPWAESHPERFILGNEYLLRQQPDAYIKLHGRVFAHGRDPFFAPWRNTLQLDYGNPDCQEAMIQTASSIAARCDGLRCDEAMLLLPDVFQSTWNRPMQPFWRRCLDRVRSEHPGTIFMAEVYWNREYELQQVGFDFTYDKILYDRLLSDDAESIRAHLRASTDYQSHCVRFLENDDEQRAAARFPFPDHHRGALFITGMVPGMLLCHHGQEDGRRLHASLQSSRRPVEDGSEAHRKAYRELLTLLSEPARHDGTWMLLEPRGESGRSLVACLWTLPAHHWLLVVVNASWQPASGAVEVGPLATRDCQFQDYLAGGTAYQMRAEDLRDRGIEVSLQPWGAQVFRIMPLR